MMSNPKNLTLAMFQEEQELHEYCIHKKRHVTIRVFSYNHLIVVQYLVHTVTLSDRIVCTRALPTFNQTAT